MESKKAPSQDPLLACLVTITKLMDNPFAPSTLVAGLPLVNNQLTPELFPRAANRAELDAVIEKVKLNKIPKTLLPAILFLKNEPPCVLNKLDLDKEIAEVIYPMENEIAKTIPLSKLNKKYTGDAILLERMYHFDPRAEEPVKVKEHHWFWRVIHQALPTYSEVLIASFLINLFALAIPLFVLNVYDRVVPNEAIETLWVLASGMLIIILFEFMMRNLRSYYIDTAAKKIDAKLSANTFEQALGLNMSNRPNSVGSLANTMISFESFRDFITSASISLLVDIPFVLIFIAVIWMLNAWIVIVPIVAIILIVSMSLLIHMPLGNMIQKSYRHATEKQAVLVESLMGVETIKTLCAEGPIQRRWENITQASANINAKIRFIANFGLSFAISIQFLSTIAVVIIGVYAISAGTLTIGGLIACIILNRHALSPIVQLANLLIRYKQTKSSLSSLDRVMHLPTERPKHVTFIQKPKVKGEIEFKDVTFTYPGQPMPALNKVSFKIAAGRHVGIIGRAGSGKSTIEKLILKLYQPDSGRILIDGVDLNQIDPAELRKQIGYIPQTVVLFHGSIRDNIVMPDPFIHDESLLHAAEISGVKQFVHAHPDGYDRQVGERGSLLSGGQQQAIGIARAAVLNPVIYLFDEPTVSLDNATIKHFVTQFSIELKNKTLLLITHKTNVLALVDDIIVMDNGNIVAQGEKQQILDMLKELGTTPSTSEDITKETGK